MKKKEMDIQNEYVSFEELKQHINLLKEELANTTDIVKTINSMWQGKDKERFLKELDEEIIKIQKELDSLISLSKK